MTGTGGETRAVPADDAVAPAADAVELPGADVIVLPGTEFGAFYAAEWSHAVRLASLLTQQRGAAEDIAQEAFTQVLGAWDRVERPAAYLTTTIVNTCRAWGRKQSRERERLAMLVPDGAAPAVFGELADVLADLPYRQRAVLVLRYYDGLSESEIADALGCRVGTVKSLASRGLARLKKVIER